ncbi:MULTISPECIES: IclR family transcriptional regulator [unclassified Streptomyces]|uniref:IclR family transcriptional regulator n=1 Tax=unclassified Streptomyces TaxID=2593676 RepID=UPI002E2CFE6D|nr:IclR family transcriptional regulator [Streptomyces sp. NBC_01429]
MVNTTEETNEAKRSTAGSVQSVDRAVSVLEILAARGEAGVTAIADELGVHRSTAFRLLGVLESRGLVGQEKDRGKYYLAAGVLRLAGAAALRLDISQEGVAVLRALAEDTGETANIAILDKDAAVNIMQARGSAAVTAHNWLGRRFALHATATGKVLLANLPEGRREEILARGPERFTERTITGRTALRAELATVAEQGHARTVEELESGLNAVGAEVRRFDGSVVGAIGVSGPAYRMTEESLSGAARKVVEAAQELSRRMGHGG